MRSKLILGLAVIIIVASIGVGVTLAIFTDQDYNSENIFSAGTVDIAADRNLGDPIPGPMFYTTVEQGTLPDGGDALNPTGVWWPGRTEYRNLDVRNMGSLQVRINRVSAEITSINGADPQPPLSESFAANMHVKIYVAGHPQTKILYEGSLANLLTIRDCIHKPVIAPFTNLWPPMVQLVYEVTMLPQAGNDLQGIVPVVSFNVYAEQTKNNP